MIRVNLIPRDERVSTRPAGPNWALIAAVVGPVIYGLVLGAVVMVQNHESTVLGEMVRQEEEALGHYGPALEKIDLLKKQRADVQSRLDAMDQLDNSRRMAVSLLETLNRSIPSYLWVEKMEETGAPGVEIAIKGNTFSNLVISDFIERLEETELFDVVDLDIAKEARIGETRVIEFSLLVRGREMLRDEFVGEKVAAAPLPVWGG